MKTIKNLFLISFVLSTNALFAQLIPVPDKICRTCDGKLLGEPEVVETDYKKEEIPALNRVFNAYSYDLYDIIQRNWIAFEDLNYVTSPMVQSIGKRSIELNEGEGANGPLQLLEANLGFRIPLAMGRKSSVARWRRMRFTFDYAANFRMTLDNSKPLTPWSNRVGFGYDFNFWDNYSKEKWAWKQGCIDENHPIDVPNATKDLNSMNLRVLIHHYSNGQPEGFYYYPDAPLDSVRKRNDYTSGDFSTNYLDILLSWNSVNISPKNPKRKHEMITWSIGYRWDIGSADGLFAYSAEQNNSYGRHRFRAEFDYRTGPWSRNTSKWTQQGNECYLMKRTFELHWRTAFEVITDRDLGNFQANLLTSNGDLDQRNFRWNVRSQIELAPMNSRALGFMLMAYYGRDYLNIRYDDIVWSVQLGLTFHLNKFFPTTWNSAEAVTHKLKPKSPVEL